MTTSSKLKTLFDYQKFEQNEHLSRLIKESESREYYALTDEDLACVAAAGEMLPEEDDEE